MNEIEIAAALAPLVGLPVWHTGRAHTLVWIEIGGYGLHLQSCTWRIIGPAGVITGSADLHRPVDDTVTDEEMNEHRKGRMLIDVTLRRWRTTHATQPLCVRGVRADRFGGFALDLDEAYVLEVFANGSAVAHDAREMWRLLPPDKTEPHFVVLDSGIESH